MVDELEAGMVSRALSRAMIGNRPLSTDCVRVIDCGSAVVGVPVDNRAGDCDEGEFWVSVLAYAGVTVVSSATSRAHAAAEAVSDALMAEEPAEALPGGESQVASEAQAFLLRESGQAGIVRVTKDADMDALFATVIGGLVLARKASRPYRARVINLAAQVCLLSVDLHGDGTDDCTGQYCRGCGCSQYDPCWFAPADGAPVLGGPCAWVEDDLCSVCAGLEGGSHGNG